MKTTSFLPRLLRTILQIGALLIAGQACAGTADLIDRPLSSMANGTLVRSNLMFVLDDSGSMSYNYLPDNAPTDNVCFGSVDRNLIFFDPNRTYAPPLKADGTPMNPATFSAAWNDGYKQVIADAVDLRNNNPETPEVTGATISSSSNTTTKVCGRRNDASCYPPETTSTSTYDAPSDSTTTTVVEVIRVNAPGMRCGTGTNNSCALQTTTTTTKTEGRIGPFLWATRKTGASSTSCASTDFNVVRASNASEAQKQNYANWFAFYRTRMLAMRAGAGRAFAKIDASRFRVGFSKISQHANGGADSSGFLNIRDYDSGTQKADFFTRLYTTSGGGNTPLRPALARAGRYYAKQLTGQSDPMQYACQRNYTILSTDGYWNQADAKPYEINGTTEIGNMDTGSGVALPMRDAIYGTGVGGTLADVAQYYYVTDLRTSTRGNCTGSVANQDVCENKVPTDTKDTNSAQHMTTFTLGLGLSGTLTYDKDYETQRSGDFWEIKQGTKVWPDPISNTGAERIDDLWHAAVNGRGTYYSANNAADMATSLVDALNRIDASTGSSAAAATSSLMPSSGDDWLFIPLYTTKTWDGTINAFKIDTAKGTALTTKPIWSAAERIKNQGTRKILFNKSGTLAEFNKDNLSAAGKLAMFDGLCTSGAEKLSQCTSLSTDAKPKATADNLVSFLRGSAALEQSAAADADKVFRTRASPLGDIVNGAPVYVKKAPLSYSGDGYSDYVAQTRAKTFGVLYVGANDGMLHAIKVSDDVADTTGGTELWAYVPSMVMSNLYLLADTNYEAKHRFFVDGAPVVSDIYDGSKWRTILVGGLGKGGRGYYALDITNPESPALLWEFTETNLGYSYGNPIITKNKSGKWVVMFTSGYNNVSPGDGGGYLYVVDALTGASISTIATKVGTTNVGNTSTPSNLGKINAWIDDDKLGVAARVYGGDMLGNVWRFDFDDNYAPSGREATLVAQTAGASQPITTRPVMTEILDGNYKYAVVSVATGRYLGTSDIGDTSLQSIYTFKDELAVSGLGALRSNVGMVKQTINSTRNGLVNGATVDWAAKKGWYVDLNLTSGERVNVDFDQQLNQLIVAGNVPSPTVCSPGGTSWIYYLDVGSGKPLLTYSLPDLTVGLTTLITSDQKMVTLAEDDKGGTTPLPGADLTNLPATTLRRTSWRELMN
ncbi:pilus assembly protein [Roseateles sp. DC23W]|uniref:Pilus assembly protein n=1 Tax=Pelomonas dachongensis TaxID=3299029 RepID=A0ABW7ERS9_9BURK